MPVEAEAASAAKGVPIPHPDVGVLEQVVRQQLVEARSQLETLTRSERSAKGVLSEACGTLGKLYHAYELFEAAQACYLNSQSLAPKNFRWSFYLGYVCHQRGDFHMAITSFERSLGLRPNHVPSLCGLAEVHLKLNDWELAEPLFEKALELDASCAAARLGLGRVAYHKRDFRMAVQHFEAILEIQPQATKVHHQLAMAYRELGELERAQAHLQKYGTGNVRLRSSLMAELRQLTTGVRVYLKRGNRKARAGDFQGAAREFRKAVEVDAEDPWARNNLGLMLMRLGLLEEAEEHLSAALRLLPGNETVPGLVES